MVQLLEVGFVQRLRGNSVRGVVDVRFRRLYAFWRGVVLSAGTMAFGAGGIPLGRIEQCGTDFGESEASCAFIASIIAGMPMIFITRVIL